MTREEIKEAVKVMEAFANGKKIQCNDNRLGNGEWVTTDNPSFNWDKYAYRIKPEPKYRPFRSQEECWEEMHKHPDFGWIKDNDVYRPIIKIDKENIYYLEYEFKRTGITYSSFKESLELKFTDGTQFGIKEE